MTRGKLLALAAAGLIVALVLFNLPKKEVAEEPVMEEVAVVEEAPAEEIVEVVEAEVVATDDSHLPAEVDRMAQLFNTCPPLLPIVETVAYSGRVEWVTGRAAYLGDYASHYHTSKHFISRSLHGMGNYLSDVVSTGDRFNVLRSDREIEFHLVVDLTRLKMWVYSYDKEGDQKMLLKAYPVCAGRRDASTRSGSLTPLGTYSLGSEIAVYKPGAMGTYKNEPTEMISVFGTRWIPLDREIAFCTAPCKGLGIHGVPIEGEEERRDCLGTYESNGCIRLQKEDIEELFAVIVSRPSYVHIVQEFAEAKVPGKVEF